MGEYFRSKFDIEGIERIRHEFRFGKNWPAVYMLENGKELYVGEGRFIGEN